MPKKKTDEILIVKNLAETIEKNKLRRQCGHSLDVSDFSIEKGGVAVAMLKCAACYRASGSSYNTLKNKMPDNGQYKPMGTKFKLNTRSKIRSPYNWGIEIESIIPAATLDTVTKFDKGLKKDHISFTELLYSQKEKTTDLIANDKLFTDLCKNFVFGTDGSLGRTGHADEYQPKEADLCVEIKSQILKGDEGLRLVKSLIEVLDLRFNSSCGMHVHIDPNLSSDRTIPPTDPFWSNLSSGRTIPSTDPFWSKLTLLCTIVDAFVYMPMFVRRRANNYCQYFAYTNPRLLAHAIEIIKGQRVSELYYGSFEMNSHSCSTSRSSRYSTIEFRSMPGNRDFDLIARQINRYMQCINIAHKLDLDTLRAELHKALHLDKYDSDAINRQCFMPFRVRTPTPEAIQEMELLRKIQFRLTRLMSKHGQFDQSIYDK